MQDIENIMERDRTGNCVGECRDRVREGEIERQADIDNASFSTGESPRVPWADTRNAPPGFLGGHV